MKNFQRYRLWLALAVLVLPILLRAVWFYHGLPSLSNVKSPDYAANTVPVPPVSTAVAAKVSASVGKVVLLDNYHANQFTPSEIQDFIDRLTARGAQVEVNNGDLDLASELKYVSSYIVFSPEGVYSAAEVQQVRDFVSRGGRLIVFTDPTRGQVTTDYNTGATVTLPDSEYANPLLQPFGIAVNPDYLYDLVKNEGNFRNVFFAKFGADALTSGLSQVALYGAHSIQTLDGTPLVVGDTNTLSSSTDAGGGLAAAVLSRDGNVLAVGDFTFLLPPYNTVADNSLFVDRIADFAVGGKRLATISDFPYVFERPVTVVPTGGLQMAADILAPLASLQSALQATHIGLTVNATPPANTDRLVLGSLTPSDDLTPYLEPFKLGLDDPTSVTLPDFGTISRSGVGLLLYQHTDAHNTLVLLTDLPSDLPALIQLLADGDLSSCLIQGDAGVCSIGFGESNFQTPTAEFPTLEATTPEPTPTPLR